ncbi:sulfite exporter TauE/SafE family protein [Plastoroseomonas arctica]|uniref:Probable membrane transporter protein n=1 Tax=Plastoroseomonas arctica TaxID=1509237 RepID=A0AAF1KNJ4_9PROT|nr:sulfite exporter TauE/SafE family protein [Plastoroseomonas arctica]MBR0654673.1 sulfite exporter TauE/SafE family protein [Plastoroseomonas arctica]
MAAAVMAMRPRLMLLPLLAGLTCLSFGLGGQAMPGSGLSGLVAVAVFAAVGIASIGGFAMSAFCAPALAFLAVEPVAAVRIILVCSIVMQVLNVWEFRRHIALGAIAPLLLAGLATVPIGVHLLLVLPKAASLTAIGTVICASALWSILRPAKAQAHAPNLWLDLLAAGLGGITGGIAAFPSAALTVWIGLQRWPKERQRGVMQPFILVMQVAILATITLMAPATGHPPFDATVMAYALPAILGTAMGLRVCRALGERHFVRAVQALLLLSGIAMLVSGLLAA